jgi:hypothetical protein
MENTMRTETLFPDQLEELEEPDQCPECGHIWSDDEQFHYHDCRYFVLASEEDDDDFTGLNEEPNKDLLSWQYRPAA